MKHIFLAACIICLSISISHAQETKSNKEKNQSQESLHIKVKDEVKPDIYINGKKYDFEILELLDADKIESMDVIKNEKALKEYDAPNGVILIKTKKKTDSSMTIRGTDNLKTQVTNPSIKIKGTKSLAPYASAKPKIIIDGKVASKEELEKLSPSDILSIEVVKGEEAIKTYNSKSGVIIVKSKKGKKKDKHNRE